MKMSIKFYSVAIAALMALGSLAFVSCDKENDAIAPQTEQSNVSPKSLQFQINEVFRDCSPLDAAAVLPSCRANATGSSISPAANASAKSAKVAMTILLCKLFMIRSIRYSFLDTKSYTALHEYTMPPAKSDICLIYAPHR